MNEHIKAIIEDCVNRGTDSAVFVEEVENGKWELTARFTPKPQEDEKDAERLQEKSDEAREAMAEDSVRDPAKENASQE